MFVCGGSFLVPAHAGEPRKNLHTGRAVRLAHELLPAGQAKFAKLPKYSKHTNTKKAVPFLSILGNGFFVSFFFRFRLKNVTMHFPMPENPLFPASVRLASDFWSGKYPSPCPIVGYRKLYKKSRRFPPLFSH